MVILINYTTFIQANTKEFQSFVSIIQSKYDAYFSSKRHLFRCPSCSSSHLHLHATYSREVYLSWSIHTTLQVNRLRCDSCGRTFVVLPPFLIKFKRYILHFYVRATTLLQSKSKYFIHKQLHLSLGYIRYLFLQFHHFHQDALFAMQITLPPPNLNTFAELYYKKYSYAFMQIRHS